MKVEFFEPHIDGLGCDEPLPTLIRAIVDELDGTVGDPVDVAHRISEACPDGQVKVSGASEIFGVHYDFGHISLCAGPEVDCSPIDLTFRRFNWRLIKFRPADVEG